MVGRARALAAVVLAVLITSIGLACGGEEAPTATPTSPAVEKTPTEQPEPVTWDLSLWGGSRGYTQPVERWAEAMKEQTNGLWTINIHFGEELSPSTENLDGLRTGLFEAAAQCAGYHPGKRPLATVYELPFQVVDNIYVQANLQIALNREFEPIINETVRRWNAVFLTPGPLPPHQLISTAPIRSVDDLEGLRVRLSGGMARALERVGVEPGLVPAPELYGALDQGVFDAAAFPHTYAHYAYRLHEVAKYYINGMPLGTFECSYFANKDAWDALPEQWKEMHWDYVEGPLIDDYAETYQEAIVRDMGENLQCGPGSSFGDAGVECIQFPESEFERLVEIGGQPSYDEWIEENGAAGQETWDYFQQKRQELMNQYMQ